MSTHEREVIVVVAGYEWILTSPSTLSSIEMLVESGYEVRLLARPQINQYGEIGVSYSGVKMFFYPWWDQSWNVNFQNIIFTLWVFFTALRQQTRFLLAFDPDALIPCALLATLTQAHLIYFSLEIATWPSPPLLPCNPVKAARRVLGFLSRTFWKWAECLGHRHAELTIVQDSARAFVLKQLNRLSVMEVVYVPPSLRTLCRFEAKPTYLQDKFNLRPDQIVLLTAGGIADYYRLCEVAHEAITWPEHWVLVIHGNLRLDDPYHVKLLGLCDGKKVISSRGFLPQAEFDLLVASAHVGLALYSNIGPNHFHIASGKLMQYLRCGLPVVATNFPNLVDIVEQYDCGRCVKDEGEIIRVTQEILNDYKRLSDTAQTVYEDYFQFDQHFMKVVERINVWCSHI